MESPKKSSIKRLESNVLKERNNANEWEFKYKEVTREKAELEQQIADLRRDNLNLKSSNKKILKLEERVQALSRELENSEKIVASERLNVSTVKQEMERIRKDANECIDKWKLAEMQWVTSTDTMKSEKLLLEKEISELKSYITNQEEINRELEEKLSVERRLKERFSNSTLNLETKFNETIVVLKKEQDKVYDLQYNLQNVQSASERLKEQILEKETEIKLLQAECVKHAEAESKWNELELELVARLNAEKVNTSKVVAINENTLSDMECAKNEIARLNNLIEISERKVKMISEVETSLQKALTESKEKYEVLQESFSKKSIEVREKELVIDHCELTIKKLQSEINGLKYDAQKYNKERDLLQNNYSSLLEKNRELEESVALFEAELNSVKQKHDKSAEEMVLTKTELEEKLQRATRESEELAQHVQERQNIISDLSSELTKLSEKISEYHNHIALQELAQKNLEQQFIESKEALFANQLKALAHQCLYVKSEETVEYFQNLLALLHCAFTELSKFLEDELVEEQETNKLMRISLLSKEEESNRFMITSEHETATLLILWQFASELLTHNENFYSEYNTAMNKLDALMHQTVLLDNTIKEIEKERASLMIENKMLCKERESSKEELDNKIEEHKTYHAQMEFLLAREMEWWSEVSKLWNESMGDHKYEATSMFAEAAQKSISSNEQLWTKNIYLQTKVQDLKNVLSEAKLSIEQERLESLSKLRKFVDANTEVKHNLCICQEEKAEMQVQIEYLSQQTSEHEQNLQKLTKQYEQQLLNDHTKRTELEHEITNLRKELSYEQDRKDQYKRAVEQLKNLRLQLEENRKKEKCTAISAVSKANAETEYWRDCFEKLKAMVNLKEHNTESSLEHSTFKDARLESANYTNTKSTLSVHSKSQPLQTRVSNIESCEQMGKLSKVNKRHRADSI